MKTQEKNTKTKANKTKSDFYVLQRKFIFRKKKKKKKRKNEVLWTQKIKKNTRIFTYIEG